MQIISNYVFPNNGYQNWRRKLYRLSLPKNRERETIRAKEEIDKSPIREYDLESDLDLEEEAERQKLRKIWLQSSLILQSEIISISYIIYFKVRI